jgi:putative ABC transport system permease protein
MRASVIESVRLAFDSLRSSKLRSILTLVGIILSTWTLIAVIALIHGMDVYVANSASNMGNDGFRVLRAAFTGFQNAKKFLEAQQKNPQLTRAEYAYIKSRARLVREIGISGTRSATVTYGSDVVAGVGLQGVTANAAAMSNTQVDQGRFLTDIEDQRHMAVVFLGADLKERFFSNVDPIGKIVAIDGLPFQVIGSAQSKGSLFGQSQDNYVSIPEGTYFKIYGDRIGIGYNFQALSRDSLAQSQDEIRMLIRTYRHLRPQQDDTF